MQRRLFSQLTENFKASDTSGGEIKILKNSVVLKVARGECVEKMAQFFNVIVA